MRSADPPNLARRDRSRQHPTGEQNGACEQELD